MCANLKLGQNIFGHEPAVIPVAAFYQRVLAAWIDLFLIALLIFLLRQAEPNLANWFFTRSPEVINGYPIWVYNHSAGLVVWILYSIVMDASVLQGTIGKRIVKIQVTDDSYERLSLAKSFQRNIFKLLSYGILGLGFLWVLIDSKKRSWHDIFARTLVVRQNSWFIRHTKQFKHKVLFQNLIRFKVKPLRLGTAYNIA